MAIPFYSDVEFKNNIEQKGVFINKRNYKNVLQFNCVDSLCCAFIKTKIPAEFSYCMPYIHIYGYDFQWGLLDLSLGFYIYYNKDSGGNITSSYIQDVQYNAINSSHGFPLELTSYQNDSSSPEYIGIKIDFRNLVNNGSNYHMSFVVDCMESIHTKDTSSYYLDWDVDYCKYDEDNKPKGYKWYKTSKDDLGVNNSSTTAYDNVVEKTTNDSIIDITHPEETNSNNIINILPNYNNYRTLITPKQIARELDGYSNTKLGSIGSNVEFKLNNSTESNNDYIPFVLGGDTKGKIGYSSNLKFNPSTGKLIIGGSTIIASSSITTGNMIINKDLKFKPESGSEVTLYSTNSNTTSIISDIDKRLTNLGFKKGYIQFDPEDEWIRQYVTLQAESEDNIIKRQGNYVLIRLKIDWHVSGGYTESYEFITNSYYKHKLGRIVSNNTNSEYLFPSKTYAFGGGRDAEMTINSSSTIRVVPCIEIRSNGDVYLALYGDGKVGKVYTPVINWYDEVTILGGYEANPL